MRRRGVGPPVPPVAGRGFFVDLPTSNQQGDGAESRYYERTPAGVPMPPTVRIRNPTEGKIRAARGAGTFGPRPMGLRQESVSASQQMLFQPAIGRGTIGGSSRSIILENPRPTLGQHSQSTMALPQHAMRYGNARWRSWAGVNRFGRPGMSGHGYKMCNFCKSNKEPAFVYSTHNLRDSNGKLTCPVLRRYKCRHCGATGDDAHTDSYCPTLPAERRLSVKSFLWTNRTSAGTLSRRGKP